MHGTLCRRRGAIIKKMSDQYECLIVFEAKVISSKKKDFTIMLKVVKISSGGRGNHDANE